MVDEKLLPYRLTIIKDEYKRFQELPLDKKLVHPFAKCWTSIQDLLRIIEILQKEKEAPPREEGTGLKSSG